MTDKSAFRRALGSFATGVTVVTARGPDGDDVGVTANSFNSVSLDPPLVLWSLNKGSSSLRAFTEGGYFAVHILAAGQTDLSARFAGKLIDRFVGLDFDRGVGDVPLLRDCVATFQCKLAYCYDGGDHQILVGEVIEFSSHDLQPLVYHGGRFGQIHPATTEEESRKPGDLLRLVSRVYHRLNADTQRELVENGLTSESYWVLVLLGVKSPQDAEALARKVAEGGRCLTDFQLERLRTDDFIIRADDDKFHLTDLGRRTLVRLAAVHAASEETALASFDRSEAALLKQLLRKLC